MDTTQYQVFDIPISEVYYDPEFNCRDPFTRESLHTLAESIKDAGLKFPLVVQPMEHSSFKYRLVAGHRRFRALTEVLRWTSVPCMVTNPSSELEARKFNLLENIQRQDLNITEEARALRALYPNASNRDIAKAVNKSLNWVNYRIQLLALPEKVQTMAAAGLLKVSDIEALSRLECAPSDKTKLAERAVHSRAHSKVRRPRIGGLDYKEKCPVRTRDSINRIVAQLIGLGITGLAPRVGAWCAGEISENELQEDIRQEVENRQRKDVV